VTGPSASAAAGGGSQSKQLPLTVEDSLSGLAWSNKDALAVSSWDGSVSVLTFPKSALFTDVPMIPCQETKLYSQKASLLDVTWSHAGDSVVTCSAANSVMSIDVASGAGTVWGDKTAEAAHTAPVKCVVGVPQLSAYVSGSWDSYACLWSAQQRCEMRIPLPERCYAMAARGHWLVVGCANRQIRIIDLRRMDRPFRDMLSPLKFQTRALDVATNLTWFAVTSVEGRCSVVHFETDASSGDFTFKCHRVRGTDIYPVNDVHFHPTTGAFATVGNDGVYNFWDKESRNRLKSHDIPLTKGLIRGRFNHDGSLFAVAASYDWSRGPANYSAEASVYVHVTTQQEVTLRTARR
jgi:mRNA export factor